MPDLIRHPEVFLSPWIPAFAGMTIQKLEDGKDRPAVDISFRRIRLKTGLDLELISRNRRRYSMKKCLTAVFVLMAAYFILGCLSVANAIHETIPSETQIPLPGPEAVKLNEYITKHNPYTSWNLWPGKGKYYKGSEPHGSLLTAFVNDNAYYSIRDKKMMSDGSLIVLENYSPDKRLIAVTVMYKMKGYNPQAGDWFWAKYSPGGKVETSGKAKSCIECHATKKENDYIHDGK